MWCYHQDNNDYDYHGENNHDNNNDADVWAAFNLLPRSKGFLQFSNYVILTEDWWMQCVMQVNWQILNETALVDQGHTSWIWSTPVLALHLWLIALQALELKHNPLPYLWQERVFQEEYLDEKMTWMIGIENLHRR